MHRHRYVSCCRRCVCTAAIGTCSCASSCGLAACCRGCVCAAANSVCACALRRVAVMVNALPPLVCALVPCRRRCVCAISIGKCPGALAPPVCKRCRCRYLLLSPVAIALCALRPSECALPVSGYAQAPWRRLYASDAAVSTCSCALSASM